MAFIISKAETSFSDSEKASTSEQKEAITRQLYLRSSSAAADSSGALDKEVVLRRIRHLKRLNKIKGAFQSLVGSSGQPNKVAVYEQKWLDPDDTFSSP